MPIKQVFNPLSGGFDEISQVAIGTANGLSIDSSQNLSLALSSTSTTGALSSADWNTFNNKIASVAQTNIRYVDGVLGNDSTGDGSLAKPWLTLTHAYAAITTNSETNVFVIHVAPGTYTEGGASNLNVNPYISVEGSGSSYTGVDFSSLTFTLNAVAGSNQFFGFKNLTAGGFISSGGNTNRSLYLDNVHSTGDVSCDSHLQNHYVRNCNFDGLYFNRGDANSTMYLSDNYFAGDFTADTTTVGGHASSVYASGNNFQGAINVSFTNDYYFLDNLSVASFVNLTAGAKPRIHLNQPIPAVTTITAPLSNTMLVFDGNDLDLPLIVTSNYDYDGHYQNFLVDASGGNLTFTLPNPQFYTNARAVITRTDSSSNTVTINSTPGNTIGGNADLFLSGANSTVSITADGNGGTNYIVTQNSQTVLTNPMTTLGDIIYENSTPAPARLAGNTTSTINFLSQTGTGSVSAAPAWSAFTAPTIQTFTSGSGTYTTPTSPRAPLYIRVRMVGGGGGGGGSGTNGGAGALAGATGTATTFGTSLLTANGGGAGSSGANSGAGGTASLGSGPVGTALSGATGCSAGVFAGATNVGPGAAGAPTPFGGGGGGSYSSTGFGAPANTGAGGGGGGGNNLAGAMFSGGGGSAGGFIDAIITSPAATYTYSVGTGGSGGAVGTSGSGGGAGAAGYIEVTEYYQ